MKHLKIILIAIFVLACTGLVYYLYMPIDVSTAATRAFSKARIRGSDGNEWVASALLSDHYHRPTLSSSSGGWADLSTFREDEELLGAALSRYYVILDSVRNTDRIRAISETVVENFVYNDDFAETTLLESLRAGQGTCVHYSYLIYKLCEHEGIPCTYTYWNFIDKTSHVANAVMVGDEWYFFDLTGLEAGHLTMAQNRLFPVSRKKYDDLPGTVAESAYVIDGNMVHTYY